MILLWALAFAYACAIPSVALAASGGPDAFGYVWADTVGGGPPYQYEALTGATEVGLQDDDFDARAIGFDFSFYGETYSHYEVHSNGVISFGGGEYADHQHDCSDLSANQPTDGSSGTGVPAIFAHWQDLSPSRVYVTLDGDEPNRKLVVEWWQAPVYGLSSSNPITFEVKLFEADGHIEIHYMDLDASGDTADNGIGAVVGLTDGSDFLVASCDEDALLGPNMAIGFYPPVCEDADLDGFSSCTDDCDDDNDEIHPGADELCDGLDGDCDGSIPADELDEDDDGFFECSGDCDDQDATRTPVDEDGDGYSGCDDPPDCDDEDALRTPEDGDGDGFSGCEGDCDDTDADLNLEDADTDGMSSCDGDCDDDNASVRSGAAELCDGRDNDCDGVIDENPNCGDGSGGSDLPGHDIAYGCILACSQSEGTPGLPGALLFGLVGCVGWVGRRQRSERVAR